MAQLTILAIASFFKGERFMQEAAKRGAKVYLLTREKHLKKAWPRESLTDVFAQANECPIQHTIHTVSYLARTIKFDLIVPLDDYDVEIAAAIREHFRMPGMNDSLARLFRDKLAMRTKAKDEGLPVPEFTNVINHAQIKEFMSRVPAPWMLKPRGEASATGITKIENEQQLWTTLAQKGDRQSYYVLEKYIAGDVCHVDSIVSEGKIVFAEAHRCGKPPFDVAHGGGMFTTTTMLRGSTDEKKILALNEKLITKFGLKRGIAHIEYIQSKADGEFYFLECASRVGGAHIAEMVEGSTGINLWAEWANLEIDGAKYKLPPTQKNYGGLMMTLAKQTHPDLSSYNDPEIYYKVPDEQHAGLTIRSPDHARVMTLMESYAQRFRHDFFATLPASERADH